MRSEDGDLAERMTPEQRQPGSPTGVPASLVSLRLRGMQARQGADLRRLSMRAAVQHGLSLPANIGDRRRLPLDHQQRVIQTIDEALAITRDLEVDASNPSARSD